VRQIFGEEHLAYQIDDVGGVHPAVDQQFQRNMVSAVAALQSHRFQNISQLTEVALSHLYADPPNYKMAWRAMLSAVEGLFALKFPSARLNPDEMTRRLLPVVHNAYQTDSIAQKAICSMLTGFQGWVEASLMYRHQPGVADSPEPPADIAILAISHGASLLRWLADLDENLPESVQFCPRQATSPTQKSLAPVTEAAQVEQGHLSNGLDRLRIAPTAVRNDGPGVGTGTSEGSADDHAQ
jgi:hypothetical protein